MQEEDTERPEAIDTEHNWDAHRRTPWQLHSERGPNVDAEGEASKPPKPFEELVNPQTPPEGRAYDRHWTQSNYDVARVCTTWEKVRSEHAHYSDETLSKDTLHDDYQVLFVNIVLEHVEHVVESVRAGTQPNPLRCFCSALQALGRRGLFRRCCKKFSVHYEMCIYLLPSASESLCAWELRQAVPHSTFASKLRRSIV